MLPCSNEKMGKTTGKLFTACSGTRSQIAIDRSWSNKSGRITCCSRESRTAWQTFRRGRISRVGSLVVRESRERRDKIFAEKKPFWPENLDIRNSSFQWGFLFFWPRKRQLFLGGGRGITSKLASQYPSWGLGHIDIQACPARFLAPGHAKWGVFVTKKRPK